MRTPPRYRFALFALVCVPAVASAHAVGVECKVKGDQVVVSVFFDDGTEAAGAQVIVKADAKEIATGKTDKKGLWSFAVPPPGKYQVLVDAGAGHKAKSSITIPAGKGPADKGAKEGSTVSDGPAREEATRYPWVKVGLGLGFLGLLALAFVISTRSRKAGGADKEAS